MRLQGQNLGSNGSTMRSRRHTEQGHGSRMDGEVLKESGVQVVSHDIQHFNKRNIDHFHIIVDLKTNKEIRQLTGI